MKVLRNKKQIMKKYFILVLCSFLLNGYVFSQNTESNDPVAQKILDQLSKATKSYSSIKANFTYTLENKKENSKDSQNGQLFLKGDKYKLNIAGQEVICNGNTLWTLITDAEEVQVSEPEYEDGAISPANIFTLYEKGFKYRFHSEEVKEGATYQLVNLFPIDANGKPYHTIRLSINKNKNQLSSITVMGKEGDHYTYSINSMVTDHDIPDTEFVFDPAQHPDVEVVDLR